MVHPLCTVPRECNDRVQVRAAASTINLVEPVTSERSTNGLVLLLEVWYHVDTNTYREEYLKWHT